MEAVGAEDEGEVERLGAKAEDRRVDILVASQGVVIESGKSLEEGLADVLEGQSEAGAGERTGCQQ